MSGAQIGLALGSGGWKGLAHLGVLRALEELEIRPSHYAGASVGALFAAAAACRIRLDELEQIAGECRQGGLFRFALGNLIRYGIRTPALFSDAPLRALCERLFGRTTFLELPTPLRVATVDVCSGATIWWGAPGLRRVSIADAVYASCAMPGLLPPGRVGSSLCMDGGVLDPLGLQGIDEMVDQVIVVELAAPLDVRQPTAPPRCLRLWSNAQTLVMRELSRHLLHGWDGPPLRVIRPKLRGADVLKVTDPDRVIRAGYDAAWSVLGTDSSPLPLPFSI